MVEALACGTPVVAYPRGAAPEIVRDGVNGFLAAGILAAARALTAIGRIDRRTCRADVESRFSVERMVDDYVAVYRRAVALHGGACRHPNGTGDARPGTPTGRNRPTTRGSPGRRRV
jgi:Na+-translocating ferredoxin:NAD+ oxidoreductase RnfC subunit